MSVGKWNFSQLNHRMIDGDLPLTYQLWGILSLPLCAKVGSGDTLSPDTLCLVLFRCLCHGLTCLPFAFGLGRLAIRLFLGQEQLAQGV